MVECCICVSYHFTGRVFLFFFLIFLFFFCPLVAWLVTHVPSGNYHHSVWHEDRKQTEFREACWSTLSGADKNTTLQLKANKGAADSSVQCGQTRLICKQLRKRCKRKVLLQSSPQSCVGNLLLAIYLQENRKIFSGGLSSLPTFLTVSSHHRRILISPCSNQISGQIWSKSTFRAEQPACQGGIFLIRIPE